MVDLQSAIDAVLRRAVIQKDDAIIDAYREIYQKAKPTRRTAEKEIHAALRLGFLVGLEMRGEEDQPTLW